MKAGLQNRSEANVHTNASGFRVQGLGFRVLWDGLYRDNGQENGNYYGISGLHRDNGKENGNY